MAETEIAETPQTPAEVAAELSASLQDVAANIQAIADHSQDSPASPPAAETEVPAAVPTETPAPASAPFALASALGDPLEQLMTATRLQHENLNLVQTRLEHHGSLFAEAADMLRELSSQMADFLKLHEQVLGDLDEHVQHLGLVTAALTKLHLQQTKRTNEPSQS